MAKPFRMEGFFDLLAFAGTAVVDLAAGFADFALDFGASTACGGVLADSFSSLFCSRRRAMLRSSFTTWASRSALFIFGAAVAGLRAGTLRALDLVDLAGAAAMRFFDPTGRPSRFEGAASTGLRLVLEAFLTAARAIMLCFNLISTHRFARPAFYC